MMANEISVTECNSKVDEQRVIMLAEDIVYCASHSRAKMPKYVRLAMSLHHLTRSKEVIMILNRMGHCVSYDDVEIMDTSLAKELLAKAELYGGVVMPTNITSGSFVQAAADNNDINEETIDGKATTHSTTLVLYQKGQFGPLPQTRLLADYSCRIKSLQAKDVSQKIQDFSAYSKKPPVTSFLHTVRQNWFRCDDYLTSQTCKMDLAWNLVRMCPSKLFDAEFVPLCSGEQQMPSWSGFNAIIHNNLPIRTTVGYCPMIHGSSTESTAIYTVMKKV